VPKGFFLVIIELFFSIKGSLELSKEPFASYIEPQLTIFFLRVYELTALRRLIIAIPI